LRVQGVGVAQSVVCASLFCCRALLSSLLASTCIIRRDYLHYIPKYNRYEKRHKNLSAHISPCFRDVQLGDLVTVGQCRPLSKVCHICLLYTSGSPSFVLCLARGSSLKSAQVSHNLITTHTHTHTHTHTQSHTHTDKAWQTVRFNVIRVAKSGSSKKQFKKF
jgi:ribosomal protein S17